MFSARINRMLAQSEREKLLDELQALNGKDRDLLNRLTAGKHNDFIRYAIETNKGKYSAHMVEVHGRV